MSDFPFFAITIGAFFTHVVSGIVSISIEAVFNSGGWMREWSKLAQFIRFFSVQRDEMRFLASWVAIIVSRIAICVAAVSLFLDVLI